MLMRVVGNFLAEGDWATETKQDVRQLGCELSKMATYLGRLLRVAAVALLLIALWLIALRRPLMALIVVVVA
jgi:hypothetical protein